MQTDCRSAARCYSVCVGPGATQGFGTTGKIDFRTRKIKVSKKHTRFPNKKRHRK